SIFILWGLSAVYAAYGGVPAVAGILAGLKPAVVALVIAALLRIGRRALRPPGLAVISAAAFAGIYFLKIPFPAIILGAAVCGYAAGRVWQFGNPAAGSAGQSEPAEAQSRERIATARRSGLRFAKISAAGVLLWVGPFLALVSARGWQSLHARQYRFFTQAAFVTFGGAYAVLAYVTQAAVEAFHWITSSQAIDGLGLAETTPGPLIMVLQFVGFMAGWNHPEGMTRLAGATPGAPVTHAGTFLPPFFHLPPLSPSLA